MKTNKQTGEQYCENRKELAEKYFDGFEAYANGNIGIVTLFSDLQHEVACGFTKESAEHYRQILNDVKCILIEEDKKNRPEADIISNAG